MFSLRLEMIERFSLLGLSRCIGCCLVLCYPCLASEDAKEDVRQISELPAQEQFARRSLKAKLDLLRIYHGYLAKAEGALIGLMRLVEERKATDGAVGQESILKVVEEASFPEIQEMKVGLERMLDDKFVGYKINQYLQLLSAGDSNGISSCFDQLEDEILNDINCYAEEGVDLPQYRYMLDVFSPRRRKSSIQFTVQLFERMNPALFKPELLYATSTQG